MDFKELCQNRFSVRDYKEDAVPEDKLQYIKECVQLAPSACNKQPWLFIEVTSPDMRTELQACYEREWFTKAPLYIVACNRTEQAWVRPKDGKHHGDIDVSIAIEHLCLAATSVGLGTCWICNFDVARCKETLQLPEGLEPVALIPIGFPVSSPTQKNRKELGEIWQEL